MDKAHIQHSIGFIEHEEVHLIEMDKALSMEVQQSAAGGDEDVDTPSQITHLSPLFHPQITR